jgi:hypothetical protein
MQNQLIIYVWLHGPSPPTTCPSMPLGKGGCWVLLQKKTDAYICSVYFTSLTKTGSVVYITSLVLFIHSNNSLSP